MLDLAEAGGLSVSTVKRMETAEPQLVSEGAFVAVQATFESAGMRFLADDGYGVGLQFRAR